MDYNPDNPDLYAAPNALFAVAHAFKWFNTDGFARLFIVETTASSKDDAQAALSMMSNVRHDRWKCTFQKVHQKAGAWMATVHYAPKDPKSVDFDYL